MQILNDDFVWPSDADRAENLALDRVCAELEDLVDRLEAAADVDADRQAVLDLAAQALGVDGEPHQGRDQRILEAIDALAAHVEEIRDTLDHNFTSDTARVRKLREVMDKGPKASLKSHDFNLGIKFAQEHRDNLARLKAQWQAEALASLRADWQAKGVLGPQESLMLMNREQELRRQAEGEDQ